MLEPGTRLGVYEIAAPLGAGGRGEVYRDRDTALGRTVAIKILPEAFLSDPERVARFEREAQLLAAVNHPHMAPNVDRARWQVSADGGSRPVWRRDGKEIFYVNGQGLMPSAAVTYVNGQIELGRATPILSTRYVAGTTSLGLDLRGYDVSADGKRFLVVQEPPLDPGETQRDSGIVVAADWTRELNARGARR